MFTTHANISGLQVSTRVKLYELLETLVQLDNLIVNIAIKDKLFSEFIMVTNYYNLLTFLHRRTTRDSIQTPRFYRS